ncbi:hypothetical protein IE077_000553 [Cardiosporidium cionae]|uniref:Uncharacterized protein n=1 Tax=Cardiosporidium cionae TaxID=476202 RepID=A0ABQ7J840_9APIC|nr:hypothetical protein IE077_000553 [Cardiosporidium cionae]|eukprot:KAF8820162.1 hypothetical protein IE077_000553 [Cardiosporidium cionae]
MATAEAPPGLDNLDFDASVNSVTIGIEGQRLQSIGILKEEFRNMRNVQTIGDLLEQIAISQKKLEELQKYKRIDSTINCGNEPGDVTVIFRLEERKPQYSVGATLNQEKNLVFVSFLWFLTISIS